MGFFDNKKKIHVATNVSRVLEDSALPNSVKTGVIRSLFEGDEQLVENAMEELTTSIGLRAHRMYAYGKDHYTHGLPTDSLHTSVSGESVVMGVIGATLGGTIVKDYYHFGPLNNLHLGWYVLMASHGYVAATNRLGNLSTSMGKEVFLKDMVVVVTEATLDELSNGSLAQWGMAATAGPSPDRPGQTYDIGRLRPHSQFQVNTSATNDYIKVTYCWLEGTTVMTDVFHIDVLGYDETSDYHHVKYTRDGVVGYWLYKAKLGTYPTIDALFDPVYDNAGTYFPWAYFRFNKISGTIDTESPEFNSSKRLLKYLNMDYESVTDVIHENPSIDQVQQAMLMMAVPATTNNQMEARYLFDYFESLFIRTGGALRPTQQIGTVAGFFDTSYWDSSIVIQDKQFKITLGFDRIYKNLVPGILGIIGTHTCVSGTETVNTPGTDSQTGVIRYFSTTIKFHCYRRQVTNTMYEEIRVTNLQVRYHIFGEYSTVGTSQDQILLIPIDRAISISYSIPDREILYARSLHYIFNSLVVQTIHWYEQSYFKWIIVAIAVIITIFTYGSTWQSVVAALAAGTITVGALIMIVLIGVLKYILISVLVKLFVKAVGLKVAFIVALVAAAYGYTAGVKAVAGAPWAEQLMSLSTSIVKAMAKKIADDMEALQHEIEEFESYTETENDKLKKAEDLLNPENDLRISPLIIFGETPNQYYRRTIHSGNIGVLALDAISSYVDVALTLPTLNDTVGDNLNEY